MIALLQRVQSASVDIAKERVAEIGGGLLVLLGVQPDDDAAIAERLLERMLNYRVFPDAEGKMNHALRDINGGLLVVPQFTLAADTNSGNRPSFSTAAAPAVGEQWFSWCRQWLGEWYPTAQFGVFGADMQVGLVNDGPVTFWLQVN